MALLSVIKNICVVWYKHLRNQLYARCYLCYQVLPHLLHLCVFPILLLANPNKPTDTALLSVLIFEILVLPQIGHLGWLACSCFNLSHWWSLTFWFAILLSQAACSKFGEAFIIFSINSSSRFLLVMGTVPPYPRDIFFWN